MSHTEMADFIYKVGKKEFFYTCFSFIVNANLPVASQFKFLCPFVFSYFTFFKLVFVYRRDQNASGNQIYETSDVVYSLFISLL